MNVKNPQDRRGVRPGATISSSSQPAAASSSRPLRQELRASTSQDHPRGRDHQAALLKDEAKRIAIIGGGFIGMEMAEAVTLRGRKALLFESMPHVMGGYDELFQEALEDNLRKHGVELHLGETVSRIEGEGGVARRIVTPLGHHDVDMVVFAIGVRPNTDMFTDPRLESSKNSAITVTRRHGDRYPDDCAAGDCAALYNAVTGKLDYIALGTTANKQGPPRRGRHARGRGPLQPDHRYPASSESWTSRWAKPAYPSARPRNAASTTAPPRSSPSAIRPTTPAAPYLLTAKIVYDKRPGHPRRPRSWAREAAMHKYLRLRGGPEDDYGGAQYALYSLFPPSPTSGTSFRCGKRG